MGAHVLTEALETLQLAGLTLEALSIGGLETTLHLPRHKLAFDIARCPPPVVNRSLVFFTHGHMDHVGGIAYHCATRALRGMPPPTYVFPPSYLPDLERLFEAWRVIDRSEMPHRLHALRPGESYAVQRGLRVEPFRSYHTAPAQGYAVVRSKQKLLPEHHGRPGHELQRLREEGVVLTRPVDEVEFAYCGDTTIEVIEREELPRAARVLALECTFVDERIPVDAARERGHVHLDEIAARAELFSNDVLLLHHFSSRFTATEIRAAIDQRLPAGLRERVVPLLGGHRG